MSLEGKSSFGSTLNAMPSVKEEKAWSAEGPIRSKLTRLPSYSREHRSAHELAMLRAAVTEEHLHQLPGRQTGTRYICCIIHYMA